MFDGPLGASIMGRARSTGQVEVAVHDLREHGEGRHRVVDAPPFGGGGGMVIRVDVVDRALTALRRPDSRVVLMDPVGARFDQGHARRLASLPHLVLLCGHYEGIDARVREHLIDESISIGDYVLTGGELPAMVVIDAVTRLQPGVLGNPASLEGESFSGRGLGLPCFTRPREFHGWAVPEVLLSGHHARIDAWRREEAAALTRRVRPDLLPADPISAAPIQAEPVRSEPIRVAPIKASTISLDRATSATGAGDGVDSDEPDR